MYSALINVEFLLCSAEFCMESCGFYCSIQNMALFKLKTFYSNVFMKSRLHFTTFVMKEYCLKACVAFRGAYWYIVPNNYLAVALLVKYW